MPLSEKVRIEIYLPDLPDPAYRELLDALEREFTHSFGGSTTIRGISGSYLSRLGLTVQDRVNLVYTDTPFSFDEHLERLSRYADALRNAAFEALEEEAVLVAAYKVYHSD